LGGSQLKPTKGGLAQGGARMFLQGKTALHLPCTKVEGSWEVGRLQGWPCRPTKCI
jgi:hypothetical protein